MLAIYFLSKSEDVTHCIVLPIPDATLPTVGMDKVKRKLAGGIFGWEKKGKYEVRDNFET